MASLIKRVFVIVVAIIWFGNRTTPVQALGIALTFLGLYLYDRNNDTSKAERRAKLEALRTGAPLLPLTNLESHNNILGGTTAMVETPASASSGYVFGTMGNFALGGGGGGGEEQKLDAAGPGRPSPGKGVWLPPGINQDETWRPREVGVVGM